MLILNATPADPLMLDVQRFAVLDLGETGDLAVSDRFDRKFVIPLEVLPPLLAGVASDYRVLPVGSARLRPYETLYFDTPDLRLYRAHHAGARPREKLRIRSYLDTGDRFVECKRRLNTTRTVKTRVRTNPSEAFSEALTRLADETALITPSASELSETVLVSYRRLTLVRLNAERVTIDVDLRLNHHNRTVAYPRIAWVELKHERRVASPFARSLRNARIRPWSMSKYCLGVCHLVEHVKKNRFREALRYIEKTGSAV